MLPDVIAKQLTAFLGHSQKCGVKMNTKIFPFVSCLLTLAFARGPHHPRGEKVIKRHVHYKPSKTAPQKLTEDEQLLHDTEHIQEHLEEIVPKPDLSKMTDEELEFYYFQLHDKDKNSKLDGLELLQAISHIGGHDYDTNDENEAKDGFFEDFEYFVELIDKVLIEDDVDQDGYLSYPEYVAGRRQPKINKRLNNEIEDNPVS
ncbi:hypothetical protein NQ317_011818 [Molorchus minor]|uniref:EF-hand domain-containing protein n=1 Tax=Molorchus minor TaxID=1323400 RepID=A0ABQ9JHE2_9CUCU|nr:hypothetical protein NQ317_011818 [Molorchus minor]